MVGRIALYRECPALENAPLVWHFDCLLNGRRVIPGLAPYIDIYAAVISRSRRRLRPLGRPYHA